MQEAGDRQRPGRARTRPRNPAGGLVLDAMTEQERNRQRQESGAESRQQDPEARPGLEAGSAGPGLAGAVSVQG